MKKIILMILTLIVLIGCSDSDMNKISQFYRESLLRDIRSKTPLEEQVKMREIAKSEFLSRGDELRKKSKVYLCKGYERWLVFYSDYLVWYSENSQSKCKIGFTKGEDMWNENKWKMSELDFNDPNTFSCLLYEEIDSGRYRDFEVIGKTYRWGSADRIIFEFNTETGNIFSSQNNYSPRDGGKEIKKIDNCSLVQYVKNNDEILKLPPELSDGVVEKGN